MANGLTRTASKKIYIITHDNIKKRYTGQQINPGDTIYIPESFWSSLTSYLTPISAFAAIISTTILIFDRVN